MQAASAALARQHAAALRGQINEKEAAVAAARRQVLQEAQARKAEAAAELAKIEAVRQRKLQELQGAGVPSAYLSALQRKKFGQ